MVAAAVLERDHQTLAGLTPAGRHGAHLQRVVAQGLQIAAPPGPAGAETRVSVVEKGAHVDGNSWSSERPETLKSAPSTTASLAIADASTIGKIMNKTYA